MKIQDQVCTRLQGKRLHELGISNAAYFQWGSKGEIHEEWTVEGPEDDFVPAWTVAELGIMLPDELIPVMHKNNEWNWGTYSCLTEAIARAVYLIYLLENKIITPESVNQRLKQ